MSEKRAEFVRNLIKRLARDIETFRMLLQEREAETTKQQLRIEELEEELNDARSNRMPT